MRNRFLLPILVGAMAVFSAKADTITMNLLVGVLANSSGTPLLDGSLLQVIASPDATFSTPTTDSFLGGNSNDILLKSISFDSSTTGVSGAMQLALTIDLADYPSQQIAGDYFVIRWFPSLTTSNLTPGSTSYGQFGYPDGTNPTWIIGSASSITSYTFRTTSAGGTFADSTGYATNITAVPEPSSYAIIIALFSLGLLIKHSWRSRIAA